MRWPMLIIGAVLLIGAGWLYFHGSPAPQVPSAQPTLVESPNGDDGDDDDTAPFRAPLPPDSADHEGTDVDGDLEVGPEGHLRLTPAVRRVFDYFLMDTGAESPEVIEARLFDMAATTLPPLAAREVRHLWRKYRALRAELAAMQPDAAHANVAGEVEALDALTAKYFSPAEREALFGEELRDAHAVLGPLQDLEAAPDMPQAARDAEWERVLEHEAPDARDAQMRAMRADALIQKERALREGGGDAQAVRALRQQALGPEAAARLDSLDARRAAWQARLDAFRAERDRLRADDSLSDEERDAQVQRLLDEHFDGTERVRAHALLDRE